MKIKQIDTNSVILGSIPVNDDGLKWSGDVTSAVIIPTGPTNDRPSSPISGMFRINSDTNMHEGYINDVWVSFIPMKPVIQISSTYTIDTKTITLLCDATSSGFNIILPSPSIGCEYTVKRLDSSSNTISILPSSPTEGIDGRTSFSLIKSSNVNSVTIISDGVNWFVI